MRRMTGTCEVIHNRESLFSVVIRRRWFGVVVQKVLLAIARLDGREMQRRLISNMALALRNLSHFGFDYCFSLPAAAATS